MNQGVGQQKVYTVLSEILNSSKTCSVQIAFIENIVGSRYTRSLKAKWSVRRHPAASLAPESPPRNSLRKCLVRTRGRSSTARMRSIQTASPLRQELGVCLRERGTKKRDRALFE